MKHYSESSEKSQNVSSRLKDSAAEKFIESANAFFVASIPSEEIRKLPKVYLYIGGLISFAFFIGAFLGIFLQSYETQIRTNFLAPLTNSGIDPSLCQTDPIANSGTYLGTVNGSWQGSPDFKFVDATFAFYISDFVFTPEFYSQVLVDWFADLNFIGVASSSFNLGPILLNWMTYSISVDNGAQSLYLLGTPQVVFDRQYTVGSVSSFASDCNASSESSFNAASYLWTLSYNYQDFATNSLCNQISPPTIGYSSLAGEKDFSLTVDTRSLITAVAINSGFLAAQVVPNADIELSYQNQSIYASYYYNPQYPGMDPIACLYNSLGRNSYSFANLSCLIPFGNTYGIPVFNHFGNSSEVPFPCDCSKISQEEINDPSSNCNIFNFISGLLFYEGDSASDALIELLYKYPFDQIISLSFNATFLGSVWGKSSSMRSEINRQSAYEWCNNQYGSCNFVIFSSFSEIESGVSKSITEYYYQLFPAACTDTFSIPPAAQESLIQIPFAPLTQNFQTCSYDPFTVFNVSLGTSLGIMFFLGPCIGVLVVIILFIVQVMTGLTIFKTSTFSEEEKSVTLDELAEAILLVRERRQQAKKTSSNTAGMNVLEGLEKELSTLGVEPEKKGAPPANNSETIALNILHGKHDAA